ncbi:hypothetical protein PHMEG_00031458 [Phytophthora megakarya]|uniref:Uncharacterized protein n=1 Tax=Phytophthora megakarya TaxID=4795 RepID=A0A225V0E7_9STRA|nr:hypothetical protein PHMEG_00031458 [Phytophthora megakarya]
MAQVSPFMASNDITVVVFPTKDDNADKTAIVEQTTSVKQKIVVGVVYTLVSGGFLYSFFMAFTFFGEFFTLLLAGTQHY